MIKINNFQIKEVLKKWRIERGRSPCKSLRSEVTRLLEGHTVTVFISDVGYFMSVCMRLVVWVTPTFFFAEDAVGLLGIMVWYNPFTYFVEVFHDILYFGIFPHATYLLLSAILAFGSFVIGAWIFFHYEDRFPEVL